MKISDKLRLNNLLVLALLALNTAVAIYLVQPTLVTDFLLIGIELIIISGMAIINRHVSKGILCSVQRLAEGAEEFRQGILDHRIETDTDDELQTLASAFNQMAEAQRRSESALIDVLDGTSAALVLVDKTGHIARVNNAAQTTFGYEENEMVGQPIEILVPKRQRADHVGHRTEFAAALETRSMSWKQNLNGRQKIGQEFPVAVDLYPINIDSEPMVLATIFDMTEVRRLEQQSADARLVAENATKAKSAFLANMSHEIRTPMNGVLGMLELLLDTELSPGQRETAETAHSSADVLLTILNDILDVSKIEAREVVLEEIPFELAKVVGAATKVLVATAADRGNEIHLDIGSGVPAIVRGDSGRLRQIIANLVSNALKFTEKGEVVVAVTLVAECDGNANIRFAVRDTGIGIPADKLELIFREFSQADASVNRTHGGTGLGLTISERLVAQMGGRLQVASQVGEGSEFWFEIPLPVEQRRTANEWIPKNSVSLRGRRFLVVDDNATACRIMREAAESVGASCDQAESTNAGLKLLRQFAGRSQRYDAVIIDAIMPERDGFELAAEINADPELQGTQMIMITSSMDPEGPKKAEAVGITGYLNKPVARVDIIVALQTLLGLRGRGEGEERRLITENSMIIQRETLSILLAEDNLVNQKIASAMLRKWGHEVCIASNGHEAVAMVQNRDFDIVLMDVRMPEMDGLEATRKIRAMPGYEDLPIVALTAHALAEERDRCREAGMNGFLSKPFRGHELLSLVENSVRASANTAADDVSIANPHDGAPAPVNLNAFREAMREVGIEEVVDTTLATFCTEMPDRMAALKQALDVEDLTGIAGAAHAMKSAAGAIHAVSLAAGMSRLEKTAIQGDAETSHQLVQEVRTEFNDVMTFLDDWRGGNS